MLFYKLRVYFGVPYNILRKVLMRSTKYVSMRNFKYHLEALAVLFMFIPNQYVYHYNM